MDCNEVRYSTKGVAIIGTGLGALSIGDMGEQTRHRPGDDIRWEIEPQSWIETTIRDLMYTTAYDVSAEKRQQIAAYVYYNYPDIKLKTNCLIGTVARHQELRVGNTRYRVVGHEIFTRKLTNLYPVPCQ